MASHRVQETAPASTHHHPHNSLLYGMSYNNPSSTCEAFDIGELEEAIVLQEHEAKNKLDHHQSKQSMHCS